MPWTINDVEKFKKGLTEKQKEKWVAVANGALKECTSKGGEKIDCEQSAIRIANSKFSEDAKLSQTRYLKDQVETEGDLRMETRLRLALSEIEIDEDEEFQMVLPVGVFYSDWYGEIIITNSFVTGMVDNWKNKVLGNRAPFIDTLHDRGKANGWIEDLDARDDGLYAKIRWTKQGQENIEEEYFKYFSSDLGQVTHIESGEKIWPVLFAVALCNTPVMNTMPQAHLSEPSKQFTHSAHSDGVLNIPEGNMDIKLADVLEYLKSAEGSEKTVVLKELGASEDHSQVVTLTETVTKLEGEKKTLEDVNVKLSDQVKELQSKDHLRSKAEVIEKALTEGRILPKDKEEWEKRFDENPQFTTKILEGLPTAVDFKEHGNGSGGDEGTFDAEGFAVYRNLNPELSEDEARKEFVLYSKEVK